MRRLSRMTAGVLLAAAALVTAPAAASSSQGSQVARPHKGTEVGVSVVEACDETGFPVITCVVTTVGSSTMTHLGRVSTSSTGGISLDLAAPPCVLPDGSFGLEIQGSGDFVFVAANGDKVFGSYQNTLCSAEVGGGTLEGTQTITGGTGRFEGASGATVTSGSIDDPEPNTFLLDFVGTITY